MLECQWLPKVWSGICLILLGKISSISVHRYYAMLEWADGTVAYELKFCEIQYFNPVTPQCAFFVRFFGTMMCMMNLMCHENGPRLFVCEVGAKDR